MIKMARIHLSYMISKRTLVFMALSNMAFVGMTLYQSHFDGKRYDFLLYAQDHMTTYAHEMILFIRIMMLFFLLFLSMITPHRHYEWFYLAFVKRFTMMSSRVLSWLFIYTLQLLFFVLCYIFIPFIMHHYLPADSLLMTMFISIWLELGIVQVMLLLIKERFDNPFSGYLVIVIYWVALILTPEVSASPILSVIHFIFPIAMMTAQTSISFLYGIIHAALWMLVLLGLILIVYEYKDL